MKRAQRRLHIATWIVLAPLIAMILWLSLQDRQADPVNETLPEPLAEETT